MTVDMAAHETLVWIAKSFGLIYMMGFFLLAVAYAYWPKNRKRFDEAAASILVDEDKPWR